MARCNKPMDFEAVDDALGKLIAAQLAFSKAALGVLNEGASRAMDGLRSVDLPTVPRCCDIPEPCWMPKDLGEICCTICPGDVGEICFVVGNEDFQPHDYKVIAAGEHASLVNVSDPAFTLGPKERRVVTVKFRMPQRTVRPDDSCCDCNDYEAVIWVQGCHNHYLRWYLNELDEGRKDKCCHEVVVNDVPDYELHWYDHFHIYRPCPGPAYRP